MHKNIQTLLFFLLLGIVISIPYVFLKDNKSFQKSMRAFYSQSENSKAIYTGKVRDVYNPLDQAFKITPFLSDKIELKEKFPHTNLPVLSLWVNDKDLYGADGIIDNGYKTGRLWERAALVKFFYKGQAFQSYAGVRLHGGTSRSPNHKEKSFRLYFRKKYGEESLNFDLPISLASQTKLKRVIVRRDAEPYFNNEITAYMIQKLGGLAPNFLKVAFYLNGKFYGYHNLTEQLSPEQIRYFMGHDDFLFVKLKGDRKIKERVLFNRLRLELEQSKELNFDLVQKKVDMDSIISSLLVIMFTGNTDWAQGVYIKDNKNPESLWRLISWDFDRAFLKNDREARRKGMSEAFEKKSVSLGMDMKVGTVRWSVFNKLIHHDQKFREYFSTKVDELYALLNSKDFSLKMDELQRLIVESQMNKTYRDSFDETQNFLKARFKVFCLDLKNRVKLIPPSCELSNQK